MKHLSTGIEIDASAATVWAVLTDFASFPDWNPFIPRIDGEISVGSRLEVVIQPPDAKSMTFRPTVVEVKPEREFRWLGRVLMPGVFDGEHSFEIVPLDEGRVRFLHFENFRGLLVPFLWKGLDTNTRRGFEEMNRALKERAEERETGG